MVGVLMAFLAQIPSSIAQAVDRSSPPVAESTTGGFTIRRLYDAVTVDGREWIDVPVIWSGQVGAAANGEFSVSLRQSTGVGDFSRAPIVFERPGAPPVRLKPEVVAYAYITDDARWIFVEPLDVIDVSAWRRYSLSERFGIRPYAVLTAISADGRRLVFSRRDCPFDCPADIEIEYYEIEIPPFSE